MATAFPHQAEVGWVIRNVKLDHDRFNLETKRLNLGNDCSVVFRQ